MKLWLDDLRPAPVGWTWVKTAKDAITLLEAADVEVASLDHDLGGVDENTGEVRQFDRNGMDGMSVINWLENQLHVELKDFWPKRVIIHSLNPRGRIMAEVANKYCHTVYRPFTGLEL